MRFLMIDKICSLERGKRARGIKNITWNDRFLQEIFPDVPVYSSIIAAESAAQLVSWAIIEARDFTVKPVITIVDSYTCTGHIRPGDQLEVVGEIESFSEESALANGSVLLNGKTIIELKHAVCYLYPLHELDPPEQVRMQFNDLYQEGYPLPTPDKAPLIMREKIVIPRLRFVDKVMEGSSSDRLAGIKNITATDEYFRDHFPLKPILPGVVIMESLVEVAALLTERTLAAQGIHDIKPVFHQCLKTKFRKFIQPGDQLVMEARITECSNSRSVVKVKGSVNNKNAAMITAVFKNLGRDAYSAEYLSD